MNKILTAIITLALLIPTGITYATIQNIDTQNVTTIITGRPDGGSDIRYCVETGSGIIRCF